MAESNLLSGEGSIIKEPTTIFIDESKEYIYERGTKLVPDQSSIIHAEAGSGSGGGEVASAKEQSFILNPINISADEYNLSQV